jgi:hypothetical protein
MVLRSGQVLQRFHFAFASNDCSQMVNEGIPVPAVDLALVGMVMVQE